MLMAASINGFSSPCKNHQVITIPMVLTISIVSRCPIRIVYRDVGSYAKKYTIQIKLGVMFKTRVRENTVRKMYDTPYQVVDEAKLVGRKHVLPLFRILNKH